MHSARAGRPSQYDHDVGSRTFAACQERPDDLGFEPGTGPAGRYDDDARQLLGNGRLEVDHRRADVGGQVRIRLGMEGCPGDGRLRTGCEDGSGSDEIFAHELSIEGESANWVAHGETGAAIATPEPASRSGGWDNVMFRVLARNRRDEEALRLRS